MFKKIRKKEERRENPNNFYLDDKKKMSDSDFFDELEGSDGSYDYIKKHKRVKTISTSDFILVLLFIFIAVVLGIFVQERYFR